MSGEIFDGQHAVDDGGKFGLPLTAGMLERLESRRFRDNAIGNRSLWVVAAEIVAPARNGLAEPHGWYEKRNPDGANNDTLAFEARCVPPGRSVKSESDDPRQQSNHTSKSGVV